MAYPSRGTWLWRNITRDFTYTPRLTSVLIRQEQPDALANMDCDVADVAQALVFADEDVCEALYDGEAIWRGHIKATMEDSVGGAEQDRLWVLSGQDYTAKLDDAIVKRKAKRKKENARRRIKWLLSYMKPGIWALDGRDLSGVPSGVKVEAYEYFGMTVREALQHVADEMRLFFYVDFDNVFHMFRTEVLPAPFALDNVAPDYSTTFPFREWTHEEESTELHNAYLVTPKNVAGSRWSYDDASKVAYKRQEAHISDSELAGPTAATNMGARALAQSAWPTEDSHCVVWEPGLVAGMTVHVEEGLWGHDFDRIIKTVEIRAVDPHDDDGKAMLHSTLTLTDRRPAKYRGVANATSKNSRKRADTGDPGGHELDYYDRVVAPPALAPGASPGAFVVAGTANEGRWWDIGAWVFEPEQDDVTPIESGFYFTAGRVEGAVSGIGDWQSWTSAPRWGGCESVSWTGIGFGEREMWWKLAIPAHPAGAAGITFTFETDPGSGYATVAGAQVVVLDAQPTALRQGTVVQQLGGSTEVDITVPIELVPAEGGELWVGLRTAFETTFKAEVYDWFCGTPPSSGWQLYHVTGHGFPYCGYSGSIGFLQAPNTPLWQVWGGSEPVLGATGTPAKAGWSGGNTVHDAGYEGTGDAWSLDGDALTVTAEEPSGKGIYVVGEGEDEDEPAGPWSDMAWGYEVTFTMSELGDTGAAGTREVAWATTGNGEACTGTLHLGDMAHDAGISVAGPTATDYEAVAFTAGDLWRAKFDTRSGLYVRGKVWQVGTTGEPANWNVQAALAETEDELDRYSLWVRAGNGAGNEQSVSVSRTRAFASVNPGDRIVKEFIGYADGLTKRFYVSHQYDEPSLRVYVNGIAVAPVSMDGNETEFVLDFWPTNGSRLHATFVVATGGT